MRALALSMLFMTTGCTWISAGDVESRRSQMDDDGDGYTEQDDCNDADPAISPGADEIWYDGIDGNCGQDDDYDADADGFVPDAYSGFPTEGVDGSGLLPAGDCNDNDAQANPAAEDVWYDGVDSDCGGEDDHDADGDGWVPLNHGGLPTENVPDAGNLPEGDCDDTVASVHPQATDTWYDGVDSDCGGEDDYDADADAYVPDDYMGMATQYAAGTGALPGGDCDDSDPTVNPAESEIWYDGTDQDCDASTVDDDQDGDGYASVTTSGTDCDDSDPDVFPDAVEILGDTVDQDCDGAPDTFQLSPIESWSSSISSIVWTDPHDLRFDANSSEAFLSLAAAAAEYTVDNAGTPVTTNYYDSAIAFSFDLTDLPGGVLGTYDWLRNVADPSYDLTDGQDFIATDDALYGTVGLESATRRTLRIGGYDLSRNARFGINYRESGTGGVNYDPFEAVSMVMDADGDVMAMGCESVGAVAQYIAASPSTIAASDDTDPNISSGMLQGVSASTCALDLFDAPLANLLTAETGGVLLRRTFDPDAIEAGVITTTPTPDLSPVDIDLPKDAESEWIVLADGANRAVVVVDGDGNETTIDVGSDPTSVHAAVDPATGDLVIGYVDSTGFPVMAFGNTSTGFTTYDIDAAGLIAEEVAVWFEPTGEYLIVAVEGQDTVLLGVARLSP